MSLSQSATAVLCVLRDFGTMTDAELSDAVLGAVDLLPALTASGYVEHHDGADHGCRAAERSFRWGLTDKGLDFVDGEA